MAEKKEKGGRAWNRPKGHRKGKKGVSGKTYQTQLYVPPEMRPLKNGFYMVRIMISDNGKRILRHVYVRKLENLL